MLGGKGRGKVLGGDKFWHLQKTDSTLLIWERERNVFQLYHRFQDKNLLKGGPSGCADAPKPPLVQILQSEEGCKRFYTKYYYEWHHELYINSFGNSNEESSLCQEQRASQKQ